VSFDDCSSYLIKCINIYFYHVLLLIMQENRLVSPVRLEQ